MAHKGHDHSTIIKGPHSPDSFDLFRALTRMFWPQATGIATARLRTSSLRGDRHSSSAPSVVSPRHPVYVAISAGCCREHGFGRQTVRSRRAKTGKVIDDPRDAERSSFRSRFGLYSANGMNSVLHG
jgi:hypothetical protein